MTQFILRRLALMALVLFVVSVVIFTIVQLLPGDVAAMILGTEATEQDLAQLRVNLGLNRAPALRYLDWIGGVLSGDWGTSLLLKLPVRPLILGRLQNSAVLALLAMLMAVPLSIALGTLSGLRRNRWIDHLVSVSTLVAVSLPEFVWGTVLILLLAYRFRLLPPSSLIDPGANPFSALSHLILPALTLTLALLAHTTRMTRASVIDVLEQPYIRTAMAKGLRAATVVLRHTLPNALLPTITIVAINIGFLMGGLVVVETVFAYPGLGRLTVDAVNHRDVPLIQMTVLLVGAVYAASNLVADILYAYLNPRIRY